MSVLDFCKIPPRENNHVYSMQPLNNLVYIE